MERLEIIKRARSYLSQMTQGINPLTGEQEPDDSILHQVRIVRCLAYTVEILDEVIAAGGEARRKTSSSKKLSFSLTDEQLGSIPTSSAPIPVSTLVQQCNALIPEDMQRLTYRKVAEWLVSEGMLEVIEQNGRKSHRPTQKGLDMGMTREQRMSPRGGTYMATLLDDACQYHILSHLPQIAGYGEEETEA